MTSSGAPVDAWSAAVDRATEAAVIEADWTWGAEPGIPTPSEAMRSIAEAAVRGALPGLLADLAEHIERRKSFWGFPGDMVIEDVAGLVRGYSDTLGGQQHG